MKKSVLFAKSLDSVDFGAEVELRQDILEIIMAQHGALPENQKDTLAASVNSKSVSFGVVSKISSTRNHVTPALHLLALCINLDSIACTPCNQGLVFPKIPVENLPSSIVKWVDGRRNLLAKKKLAANAPLPIEQIANGIANEVKA
jgi:hypothetical protein